MPRSASDNNDQPLEEGPKKHKSTQGELNAGATTTAKPRTVTRRRKIAPVDSISASMLDGDFDPSAEQDLDDSSADIDIQGLDDLDATERFDLGETVKNRSRKHAGDSLVEALDEIFDTLVLNESDLVDP